MRIWEAATLRQIGRFQGSAPIAFSPNGKVLVCTTPEPAIVQRQLTDLTAEGLSSASEKLIGLEKLWDAGREELSPNYDAYLSVAFDSRSKTIFGLHYGQCDVLGLDG